METVKNLINELRDSSLVEEKILDNNISAFNFTRDAFINREWNELSTKARGLFIDTEKNRIKARSYDKFFNIGERLETKIDYIADNWTYPIDVYIKENGYLGICSWNEDGSLFCASKRTTEGPYAERFKEILTSTLGDKYFNFWNYLYRENLSAVFEVIDPDFDPHIINYDKPQVILLDFIYNDIWGDGDDLSFTNKSYEIVIMKSITFNLQCKEKFTRIWDAAELDVWYNEVIAPDYKFNGEYVEGFVLQDLNDNFVKIKTDYYNYWKELRKLIPYISTGKNVTKTNKINYTVHPETPQIIKYMQHMLPIYYEINNEYMDILTFRQAWLEHIGG